MHHGGRKTHDIELSQPELDNNLHQASRVEEELSRRPLVYEKGLTKIWLAIEGLKASTRIDAQPFKAHWSQKEDTILSWKLSVALHKLARGRANHILDKSLRELQSARLNMFGHTFGLVDVLGSPEQQPWFVTTPWPRLRPNPAAPRGH
jgi:hypothetical protein